MFIFGFCWMMLSYICRWAIYVISKFVFHSFQGSVTDNVSFDPAMFHPHRLVSTDFSKRKYCVVCQSMRNKTAGGYRVQTVFKCGVCNVPLCRSNRNCFFMFHKDIIGDLYSGFGNSSDKWHLILIMRLFNTFWFLTTLFFVILPWFYLFILTIVYTISNS